MKYRTTAYKTIDNVYLLLTVKPTELDKSEGTLLDQFCLESTSMVIITFKNKPSKIGWYCKASKFVWCSTVALSQIEIHY